jgi:hypothetical protein
MAETNFRELFDRIPVYGETGFAAAAAAHDSKNPKNKSQYMRLRGGYTCAADRRAPFLAADHTPRKPFGYRF